MTAAVFACKICGAVVPRKNSRQENCSGCGKAERKKNCKKYLKAFYARNPNYDRDYKRWYRRMLNGEDD